MVTISKPPNSNGCINNANNNNIIMKLTRKQQWHLLGACVFLLVFTTCMRSVLYLSKHLDAVDRKDGLILPSNPVVSIHNAKKKQTRTLQHYFGSPKIHLVDPTDFIYEKHVERWDSSPIIIEEYKLVFFTVPKVACTTWKQLFRRIEGFEDWKSQDPVLMLPHNPAANGLKYLWDYSLDEASEFMTSPDYTRAIFVRDPKQRFLSAFIDKIMGNFGNFLMDKCCRIRGDQAKACVENAQTTSGFLELIHTCKDPHWDPQYDRMESKYWQYVDFVGHLENIVEDGPRLMKQVGIWDKYGVRGWGKFGNESIFGSAKYQTHSTYSNWKVWQWYTPELERRVEKFYGNDYGHSPFNFKITNLTENFFVENSDSVMARGPWDSSPIVVEKYKLIFFTIPKIAGTRWKQAFRRMQGLEDWKKIGGEHILPHNPDRNGLKYLYHYPVPVASEMMQSSNWTRAIFVRNPKDRFLSVFIEFYKDPKQIRSQCCPDQPGCEKQVQSMVRFLDLLQDCRSAHWNPAAERFEKKYWEKINFIGSVHNIVEDSRRLLEKIGAWEDIGASGWGENGTEPIFVVKGNELDRIKEAVQFYNPVVDRLLDEKYKVDLENPLFNFTRKPSTFA